METEIIIYIRNDIDIPEKWVCCSTSVCIVWIIMKSEHILPSNSVTRCSSLSVWAGGVQLFHITDSVKRRLACGLPWWVGPDRTGPDPPEARRKKQQPGPHSNWKVSTATASLSRPLCSSAGRRLFHEFFSALLYPVTNISWLSYVEDSESTKTGWIQDLKRWDRKHSGGHRGQVYRNNKRNPLERFTMEDV